MCCPSQSHLLRWCAFFPVFLQIPLDNLLSLSLTVALFSSSKKRKYLLCVFHYACTFLSMPVRSSAQALIHMLTRLIPHHKNVPFSVGGLLQMYKMARQSRRCMMAFLHPNTARARHNHLPLADRDEAVCSSCGARFFFLLSPLLRFIQPSPEPSAHLCRTRWLPTGTTLNGARTLPFSYTNHTHTHTCVHAPAILPTCPTIYNCTNPRGRNHFIFQIKKVLYSKHW